MTRNISLVLSALQISKGIGKDFTDLELAEKTGIGKNEIDEAISNTEVSKIFRKTSLSVFECPSCGQESRLANTKEIICGKCGDKADWNSVATELITVSVKEAEHFIKEEIIKSLKSVSYEVIDSFNGDFTSLTKEKDNLCIMVKGSNVRLNDYYALKGWKEPSGLDLYILFCYSADSDLIATSQKDTRCILYPIIDIEQSDFKNKLDDLISGRKRLINENIKVEELAGLHFEDYLELAEVKGRLNQMIEDLHKLALQQGEDSASGQGRTFQKYVISLLNFTLFQTKFLGGKNEPDGLIQLFGSSKKPIWIPVEVKSFKPKDSKPVYKIKEVASQLDKYSSAFEKQEITERVETPAFLTIAYDFEVDEKNDNEIIEELERKHKIKYSFMSLSALVRIINLFTSKGVSIIKNERIQEFMTKNRIITKNAVEELFKKLEEDQHTDDSILKQLRKEVAIQGI